MLKLGMNRVIIYLASLCFCMFQVLGQWHAVAHGIARDVSSQPGLLNANSHATSHAGSQPAISYGGVGAEDAAVALSAAKSAANKALDSLLDPATQSTSALAIEHDKQTCLSFDALATAASWISTDLPAQHVSPQQVNCVSTVALLATSLAHAYWPTGPPTL